MDAIEFVTFKPMLFYICTILQYVVCEQILFLLWIKNMTVSQNSDPAISLGKKWWQTVLKEKCHAANAKAQHALWMVQFFSFRGGRGKGIFLKLCFKMNKTKLNIMAWIFYILQLCGTSNKLCFVSRYTL